MEWSVFARQFLYFGKVLLAILPVAGPLVVALIAGSFVQDHTAERSYYGAVAEIIPILVLTLALERGYVFRGARLPRPPPSLDAQGIPNFAARLLDLNNRVLHGAYLVLGHVYPVLLLVLMAAGEIAALKALGSGSGDTKQLQLTVAAVSGGFAAIVALAAEAVVRDRSSGVGPPGK
jgi:hypothetical protein